MKNLTMRVTCFVVILCMVMGSFCAFAAEPEDSEHRTLTDEEVYAKLAEAFPEDFLSAFSDDVQPVEWDPENQEVVSYESRALSEAEEAVRIEYSNGAKSYFYNVSFTQNYATTVGNATSYSVNIYMTVTGQIGVMYIGDFKYTLVKNGYDRIDSVGSGSMSEAPSSYVGVVLQRATENSSGPANVVYSGTFESIALSKYNTIFLQVNVGGDNRTYSVY